MSGALVGTFNCLGVINNINGWETLLIGTNLPTAAPFFTAVLSQRTGDWQAASYEATDLVHIVGPAPSEIFARQTQTASPTYRAHGGADPAPGTRIHLLLTAVDPVPPPNGHETPFAQTHGTLDADLKNPDDPNAVETVSLHVEF